MFLTGSVFFGHQKLLSSIHPIFAFPLHLPPFFSSPVRTPPLSTPPPPLSLSPRCLFKQSCCFHINFYDLCFEEGSLCSKMFLNPELTVFPTDISMRILACSFRAIYSAALMRVCWPAQKLWRLLTLCLTAKATHSSRTSPTIP